MLESKNRISILAFGILLPICFGGAFYYLFCPEVWFVKVLDDLTGLRCHFNLNNNVIPLVILLRYYLFDFLWAVAFANLILLVLSDWKYAGLIGALLPVFIGLCYELAQLYGLTYGRSDPWDIFAEGIGSVGMICLNCVHRRI